MHLRCTAHEWISKVENEAAAIFLILTFVTAKKKKMEVGKSWVGEFCGKLNDVEDDSHQAG